ncbi:MAG: hypothetical protein RIK87_25105 [Fuerstiella sp.]
MAKTPDKRRKSVINPRVQWTLAARVVLHFLIFVCAGAVFGLINQFFADPFGGLADNLSAFWANSGPMLLALLCLMPIFIRDTLTLSNRIAGPIYNLSRTVQQLADGESDVRPLRFRKNDMWTDLPETFNQMVDRLRSEEVKADQSTAESATAEQLPAEKADELELANA